VEPQNVENDLGNQDCDEDSLLNRFRRARHFSVPYNFQQ